MILTQNYLEQLELSQLGELAKFVVEENFNHHCDENEITQIAKETEEVYQEELNYFDTSKIIIAKNINGSIEGSIRVINWNHKTQLPIQKLFNINPSERLKINKNTPLWHIGRFATRKNNGDKLLFRKLMVTAISPICENKSGYVVAECDKKLLRIMNLMGIKTNIIGNSIHYLGSETIPIAMDYDGLKGFYESNKYLTTNSQVFNKVSNGYN